MSKGDEQVLGFGAALEKNRRIFFLQHSDALYAFFGLIEYLDNVARRLQTGRDKDGHSYVSLLPFLLLIQREAMSAFDVLTTCRSYEAWVLLRPAIEAALIIGKWVDDPENAAVWNARQTRKTEYIKAFSGRGIISRSLPRAADLRAVLDHLNDEFMHANEPYYSRHTNLVPLKEGDFFLRLAFFDDDKDLEAHTLAFLHLLAVLFDALDVMLSSLFVGTSAHVAQTPLLEGTLNSRATVVRATSPAHTAALTDLGLWPAASV